MRSRKTMTIAAGAVFLLAAAAWIGREKGDEPPAQPMEIDTLAIYSAADQEFFSHGPAAVTSRQLYQRREDGGPLQYVAEYTYRTHSGGDLQRSRYLVTQQPDGNYLAKWIPQT